MQECEAVIGRSDCLTCRKVNMLVGGGGCLACIKLMLFRAGGAFRHTGR